VAGRLARQPRRTADLVRASYDRLADGYDAAWTHHMRGRTVEMLDRLAPPAGADCIDLTTGTGFVAGELQHRAGGLVVGVDASDAMIRVARRTCPPCHFICEDALDYLRRRPPASADVITCAWGLGYTRPALVLAQAARVLRPGGRIGITDNALTSLAEVLWVSLQAFAERPQALRHVMRVRFLPHSLALATLMRLSGLGVSARWDASQSYQAGDGRATLERLLSTGAAAGFEFAAREEDREAIFARFVELIDQRGEPFTVTHRYLAAVGVRAC